MMSETSNWTSPYPNQKTFLVEHTERTEISAPWPVDYVYIPAEQTPRELLLLLHGFSNDGPFMTKRFLPQLSEERKKTTAILAPNGPFPLPEKKKKNGKEEWQLGFAWYFYNGIEDKYFVSQKTPALIIKGLVEKLELDQLPLRILGYSQGGYLAPFLGLEFKMTQQVVGISSVTKHEYLPKKVPFPVDQIHGEDDSIVSYENAKRSHQIFLEQGNEGEFISVPEHHKLQGELITKAVKKLS